MSWNHKNNNSVRSSVVQSGNHTNLFQTNVQPMSPMSPSSSLKSVTRSGILPQSQLRQSRYSNNDITKLTLQLKFVGLHCRYILIVDPQESVETIKDLTQQLFDHRNQILSLRKMDQCVFLSLNKPFRDYYSRGRHKILVYIEHC